MGIYVYKGITKQGKDVKASITCDNESIAKQRIRAQGIMLLELKEQKSEEAGKSFGISLGGGRVNINDLALMTRQLATLIKARIQIVEALGALVDQIDNQKMKVVLTEVRQKVNEGTSFAKALADYPKIFNNVYVNMVDAGEASGTLDVVLLRLAEFTETQLKLKNKIQSALYYPAAMAGFGFILINIIFIKVIPQISKIFLSAKLTLPLQTKICIWISDFLQNQWYVVILGAVGSYLLTKKYLSTQKGESKWHAIQLKLPVLGTMVKMINVSRFCSTLGTLLNSGVPMLTSMLIVKNLIPNVHLKKALDDSRTSVMEGSSMTGPLMRSGHFPPLVTHMIRLGEKSGELEPMLAIVAENYEDQVNTKLNGLTAMLEPIMMVVLGLIVAFIVFSVIVPLMELNNVR